MAASNARTQTPTHIALGPLDHIAPRNIPQSVIYLSLRPGVSSDDAFAVLEAGLQKTVSQLPWLTGRVYTQSATGSPNRPGQLEICYDADDPSSVPLPLRKNHLEISMSLADIRDTGYDLETFRDQDLLWTSPFEADFEVGVLVFAAQVNFVPGGCLLVLSIAPMVADGTAMLTVTKLWADHCANQNPGKTNDSRSTHQYTFNRSVLDNTWDAHIPTGCSAVQNQENLKRMVGLRDDAHLLGTSSRPQNAEHSDRRPCLFYMPQSAYSALRETSTNELGRGDIPGNDLICAVIWRSVIRAWIGVASEKESFPDLATLAIPFDARPYLPQPAQGSFLGNMNFESIITWPLRDLQAPSLSVSQIAREICITHAANRDRVSLLSAYKLLDGVPEYGIETPQMRAAKMSPDTASVGILSPMVLPFNDTCFGSSVFGNDGRPECFRPMMGECNRCYRTCFVIPRKQHGGIEFVMTLSEQELRFLQEDEEFARYAFSFS